MIFHIFCLVALGALQVSLEVKGQESTRKGKKFHSLEKANTNSFQCQSEGFFPSPTDCRVFYRCVSTNSNDYFKDPYSSKLTAYRFECGEGTVFDPDHNVCNHPKNTRRPECGGKSPSDGQSPSEHPERGHPNQGGNHEAGSPNKNENQIPPINEDSSNKKPLDPSENCPSSGFYPVKGNCVKFFRCVDNGKGGFTKYEFSCGPGTVWDPALGVCNYPNQVPGCETEASSGNEIPAEAGSQPGQPGQPGQGGQGGQGGYPGQPGQGGYPGQPGQGGYPGQPGQGGYPGQPGQGGYSELPGQGGQGGYSELPGQGGQGGYSELPGQGGQGGYSELPGQGGQGGYPGQPGQPGQGGYSELPGQGGQPGQGGYPGQPGQGGYSELPGQGGQGGYPGQPGQPGQGGYPGQPGQGGYSELPGQGGQGGYPGQPGQPGQGGYPGQPGQGEQGGQPGVDGYPGPEGNGITPEGSSLEGTPSVNCMAPGFYGVPGNCRKFIRCVDPGNGVFMKFEFECGPGTAWDTKINTCNHYYLVEGCRNQTSAQPNEEIYVGPIAPDEPGLITTTSSPSTFSQSTSYYNPSTTTTQNQFSSSTTSSQTQTEGPQPTSDKNQQVSTISMSPLPEPTTEKPTPEDPSKPPPGSIPCEQNKDLGNVTCEKDGFYPDPTDCKKFYRCADWGNKKFSIYFFECGKGTIWDPALETCNHEKSVYPPRQCGKPTPAPSTTTTEVRTEPTTKTTTSKPTDVTTPKPTASTSTPTDSTTPKPTDSTTSKPTDITTPKPTDSTTSTPTDSTMTPTSQTSPSESTDSTTISTEPTESTTSSTDATTEATESTTSVPTSTSPTVEPTQTEMTTSSPTEETTDSSTVSQTESTSLEPTEPTESTTSQIVTTEPSDIIDPRCPKIADDQFIFVCPTGFKRHPRNCSLIYQCTTEISGDINVMVLSCKNNTVYDEKKIQCLPPGETDSCANTARGRRVYRSAEVDFAMYLSPYKKLCPKEGSFPYEDDCTTFYKCKKDKSGKIQGYVYQCPEGHRFDEISAKCVDSAKLPPCTKTIPATMGKRMKRMVPVDFFD